MNTNANASVNNASNVPVRNLLVVVDVQRDFLDPAGSLYVTGGETLPAKIAEAAPKYDAVIFTLDWHPGNHCSFVSEGGMWPSHCVAFTQGAGLADEFASILSQGPDKVQLFLKGQQKDREQYGAFEEIEEKIGEETGKEIGKEIGKKSSGESFAESVIYGWLKGADRIDVCGIAGDYCVKESIKNILKISEASKVKVLSSLTVSIDDGSTLAAYAAENGLVCL